MFSHTRSLITEQLGGLLVRDGYTGSSDLMQGISQLGVYCMHDNETFAHPGFHVIV